MRRRDQVLIAALVVQIALSVLVLWPRASATGEIAPVFPDLAAEDIVALTVEDDQGNQISLGKVDGQWVIPEADDYPVEPQKIDPVLEGIVNLESGRLVTRTDASHQRLKVTADDFVRRIAFETEGGEEHLLYLGSSPSFGATHFRVSGQDEAYLTNQLSSSEVATAATVWVNATYFRRDQEEIESVTLKNANGSFTFTKDDEGAWTWAGLPEGEELESWQVSSLVSRATSVSVQEPLGKQAEPTYGLDQPAAVVTITTVENDVIRLEVGSADAEDSSYVVKVSESPYYVRVAQYNAQALVETSAEDLIVPPATPTAGDVPPAS